MRLHDSWEENTQLVVPNGSLVIEHLGMAQNTKQTTCRRNPCRESYQQLTSWRIR